MLCLHRLLCIIFFYYGEAVILGNLPLRPEENDMFISVSESISATDPDIAYLQYGLIYKEIPLSDYLKLIKELNIGPQDSQKRRHRFCNRYL